MGLVTTSFPVAENPAAGVFVARLAAQLGRRVRLSVLTPSATSPVLQPDGAEYTVRCFRYAPRGWRKLAHEPGGIPAALKRDRRLWALLAVFLTSMLLACRRLARSCDLIHANWSAVGAIAGMAAAVTSTPVVTTLRGTDVKRLRGSLVDRLLLRLCLRTNAFVICVSESVRDQVLQLHPHRARNVLVIPNGVDEGLLSIRRSYDRAQDRPLRIVSVGSLVPGKGMELLLRATRIVRDRDNVRVTIIGDGPERARLNELISASDLAGCVRLPGIIPPAEIAEHLAKADVFVLASHFEGRPNALLEAMASGLPAIASRIPGVIDLLNDGATGLLFEPGDAEALAACLLRLTRDAALRSGLGKGARAFVLEQGLTWHKAAERYLNVYRAAVRNVEAA